MVLKTTFGQSKTWSINTRVQDVENEGISNLALINVCIHLCRCQTVILFSPLTWEESLTFHSDCLQGNIRETFQSVICQNRTSAWLGLPYTDSALDSRKNVIKRCWSILNG